MPRPREERRKEESRKSRSVGEREERKERTPKRGYQVKRIVGHTYVNPPEKGSEMRKTGAVLFDDFLCDNSLRLRVEWEGYPDEADYTLEPLRNLFPNYTSRLRVFQYLKAVFFKEDGFGEEDPNENKTVDDHRADWKKFSKEHKPEFISSVEDIVPLAAQFTRKNEKEVRVRVESLRQDFYLKVIKKRKYKCRYPVTWNGDKMFVLIPTDKFKDIYPYQKIFKATKNAVDVKGGK